MRVFAIFVFFLSLYLANLIDIQESYLPIFNLESGFYKCDSIDIIISIGDPNATIYYTLDGSLPTVNSQVYKYPITLKNKSFKENLYSNIKRVSPDRNYTPKEKVKKANIIRAMAKLSNETFTPIISKTYFVGLNRKALYGDVPIISIITDPKNLFDYEKGIYTMGKFYDDWIAEDPKNKEMPGYNQKGNFNIKGRESERPASIEYFPADENREGFNENAGIRIMGGVSRSFIQKSFRVIFRDDYGKKNLKYELIPGNKRVDGKGIVKKYKSFNIRNGGNDYETTKIRDTTLQYFISNRNIGTQKSEIVVVFLEGEYWGVYNLMENYDEHYISNNYDIDKDNVIIIKKRKVEAGVEDDIDLFNQAIDFIINEDMSNPSNYDKASKLLDLETYAIYCAFNIYIGNKDGIFQNNNWSMWRVREPVQNVLNADGKWRILLFDNELSTSLFGDGRDYNRTILSDIFNENSKIAKNFGTKLLISLLKNSAFKNMFINALSDIRNIDFEENRVYEHIEKINKIIEPLMRDDFIRFGPDWVLYGPEEYFQRQINIFKSWLFCRYDTFLTIIAKNLEFKPPVEVLITSNNFDKGSFLVNNGWKSFEKEYKGLYFSENILYLSPKDYKGKFEYWRVKNCKLAGNSKEISFISTNANLAINPLEGCTVKAYYK